MGCNSIWHLKGDVETAEYKCICWVGTDGIWRGELAGSEMQAAADGRQGKRQLGSANWAALRTEVWLSGLTHYGSICHSKPPSFRVLINQGRMVLTIRYSGSYSVLGSQILLDKWTPCTMRLSHHCAPLAQGLGSADAQKTLIQCMNK